jgi:hypothetical protein
MMNERMSAFRIDHATVERQQCWRLCLFSGGYQLLTPQCAVRRSGFYRQLLPGCFCPFRRKMSGKYEMTDKEASKQRAKVLHLTHSTLKRLLEFKTVYDIQRYVTDRHSRDFREFEAETAEGTFDGAGVIATRDNILRDPRREDDTFYHDDVPMGSHEVGAYIREFPLDAASASYVFTLIEVYGDEIAAIVAPGSINRNKAWHEDIKGFADLRDAVQVQTMRAAFAKHFGANAANVPELAVRRMVGLKRIRNDFAHEGSDRVSLPSFLTDATAVVCHIAFLITDETRISIYPWEDHDVRFSPQSA